MSATFIPSVLAIGIVVLLSTAASVVVTTGSIVKEKFSTLKVVLLKGSLFALPLPVNVSVCPLDQLEELLIIIVPFSFGCSPSFNLNCGF